VRRADSQTVPRGMRNGRAASRSARGPDARIVSVPSAARFTPPETGESTMPEPLLASRAPIAIALSGEVVSG